MRVEIFARRNWRGALRYYFRIVAHNGEPLAQSESYHNRRDAMDAIDTIVRQIPVAEIMAVPR